MSDDRFGLVMRAREAWANAEELRALGARCVRTPVDDLDQLEEALRDHPPDVRVVVSLDPLRGTAYGHAADLGAWEATLHEIERRFGGRIWALEVLSGWNRRGIEPAVVLDHARRASEVLRAADSSIIPLLGSVGGPDWLSDLHALARLLTAADRAALGGVGLQTFGKNARGFPGFDHGRFDHGEIDVAVQNAHDIVQLPIWVTAFGVRIGDAGGDAGQARYLRDACELLAALPRSILAMAAYYCWWDPAGDPHERGEHAYGLRRENLLDPSLDSAPRAAWHTFAELAGGTGREPAMFAPRPFWLLV